MARSIFYSFHYKPDSFRASQVRNMGVVEGNQPARDNDWETIVRGGDSAIKSWITSQMKGTSCTVVLIGSNTAGRKWIDHEIVETWSSGKALLGVYIHGLKDADSQQASKGNNPFAKFTINNGAISLSNVVKAYDSPYSDSKLTYGYINENLAKWIEEAIGIRAQY